MRGIYTVEFENVSVTAAQDLFELTPAANKAITIVGLELSQSSDVGDAAEEILRYRIIRGHATSGSAGSAPTPAPLDPNGSAASFTAEANNTTIASAGTPINLHSGTFNIRSGLFLWLPPECVWKCTNTQTLVVVRLMAAPADALSMSGTVYVHEL